MVETASPLDLAAGVPCADLRDGDMIAGVVGDEPVLLARQGDEVFALSAKCSHYGGPLAKGLLADGLVRCPLHHARFDIRTGEAVGAPAVDPIRCWTVERHGNNLFVRGKRPLAMAAPTQPATEKRFVIVGTGAAGFAAAVQLRRRGFSGSITMIAGEPDLPVDRPNLSKDYLAGKIIKDWVILKPQSFYDDQNIRLVLGEQVSQLDLAERKLILGKGAVVGWDSLLMATGAEPVKLAIPGANLPHVHILRALADSEALALAAKPGTRAVIIGAGFVGLEVASALITRGVSVHIVAPGAAPLIKQLGAQLGELVRRTHEAQGVVFHFGRRPVRIDASEVTLDDGSRLAADLVVMGVGVRPRTELAEAAGLAVDEGIVVNECLQTAVPGVFAAGDVARYPDPRGDGSLRIEHWAVAENMGRLAADNMLGGRQAFRQTPFFWSRHYGTLRISYVGHADNWDTMKLDGDLAKGEGHCTVRYLKAGKLMAVASVGRDHESLTAELEMDRTISTPESNFARAVGAPAVPV